MQVGPRASAGTANRSNYRTHTDVLPYTDIYTGTVRIAGQHPAAMVDNNKITVTALPAAKNYRTSP